MEHLIFSVTQEVSLAEAQTWLSFLQALKLQQKAASRLLADMQKNVTLAISAIAAEVSALHRRVSEIEDGAAVLPATCPAALPEGAGADGRVRVYPNSSADREAPAPITLSHSEGGPAPPMTINIDAMTLALELASLRSANERASRREFALVSQFAGYFYYLPYSTSPHAQPAHPVWCHCRRADRFLILQPPELARALT